MDGQPVAAEGGGPLELNEKHVDIEIEMTKFTHFEIETNDR